MRFLALLVSLAALATAPLRAAEVEFLRVWPAWREADAFERISEFFGGGENPGRQVIVRTQRGAREGFYFLVRAKSAGSIDGARFELSVIRSDAPETKTFTFPVSLAAKETVFQLGVTGADWPGGKAAEPVAWKLALLAGDGRTLAEQKSFLWEKPAK